MLRVTIEIVPHGIESAARVLDRIEIAQIQNLEPDNSGGLRRYMYKRSGVKWDDVSLIDVGEVTHHRKEGAAALAAKVLEKLPSTWTRA
jgi:hypothetical protein